MQRYYSAQADKGGSTLQVRLQGHWVIATLPDIEKDIDERVWTGIRKIMLDGEGLEDFDTSAAWFLNEIVAHWRAQGVAVDMDKFQDNHRRIFDRVANLPHEQEAPRGPHHPLIGIAIEVGRAAADMGQDCYKGVSFLGEFLASVATRIVRPSHMRFRSIVFHINEVGIKAAPIIALMAFSIAFVMGYQGAFQLQKFDATIYTVDLVVLSILREMGVLITAIMIAGRSGSAFAAQIGTMKLNEEVDALQTMGVSPFEVLVQPRLIGIIIALPLLTVIADVMGLMGGYIFSSSYLGYSYVQFLSRMQEVADMRQFYVGLSKAPVFAILIGIVGCMQGLQAQGSAEDVGRRTITAVVQSIFLVIVADAVFSVIFTKMGI